MSQLIALIIAIALGAIVTAIGFVFLGDAFTKNSERGVALQLVSQASQIEMALTAHRAENAKSAFDTNYATTLVDSVDENGLVDLGYLKDVVVAPQGSYSLVQDTSVGAKNALYLVASGANASGDSISANVCQEVEKLAGRTTAPVDLTAVAFATPTGPELTAGLGSNVYACFTDGEATPAFSFVYQVE